jgi:hypothetical protein
VHRTFPSGVPLRTEMEWFDEVYGFVPDS